MRRLRCLLVPWIALLAAGANADAAGGTAQTPPSTPEGWIARVDSLLLAEEHRSAMAIIDSLLSLGEDVLDEKATSLLLLRRGGVQTATGRAREGEPELRDGIRRSRACGDSSGVAYGLRWLSVGADMQGRPGEARRLSEDLLAMGRRSGDRSCEAWGNVGLAWRSLQEGQPAIPIKRYEEAIRLFRADGNARGEAWAENGLGIALASEGFYREAADAYRRAGSLARKAGYGLVECMAMNNLGNIALDLGDPGLGASSYERASRLHFERGLLREGTIPLINLAYCHRLLGSVDEAERCLEEARERAGGYPDLEGLVLSAMAELRSKQGRIRSAATLYRSALALGEALPLKNRVECLAGLGALLAAQDSLPAALRSLESARRLIRNATDSQLRLVTEATAGEILGDAGRFDDALAADLNAEVLARSLGQSGFRVRLLVQAARAARGLDLPDSALHLYERAALAWESERAVPMDPKWREQRGADAGILGTELGRLLLDRPRTDPESARVRRAFERMQRFKSRTLFERMTGPAGASIRAEGDAPFPSLWTIQNEVLGDDDLMLDVYVGPRVSLAFAVTRDDCRWAELPPQERIASACEIIRDSVVGELGGRRDSLALSSAIDAVGLWLLAPFRDLMPGKSRLLFSPDGPLGTIPIALLREPGTGTALLDRMDCRIVPSARILIWQQGSARKGAAAANGRLENVLALAGVADAEGRPLARAAREVRDLERHYENVSARTALSETLGPKVRLADRGYAVLHVASHVDVDDQSPWQSALCLSPGPASGRITALDIAGMRLPHRLVVLSGCETARGRALNGEGVQGLSAAFLSAGASCVVASLWPAPDRETAVLMRHFYSELAGGRTVGEALRGAQKTMREAPETRAPVYWSGFLVIGSGDVRVALQPRRFTLTSMVLAGVGFLALIAVWHGFRRRRSHQMRGL